jgi:hypothetical protein
VKRYNFETGVFNSHFYITTHPQVALDVITFAGAP